MKMINVSEKIAKIRSIAKNFRKSEYRRKFKICQIKVPVLDCITRWSSTYSMVKVIADQKDSIQTVALNDSLNIADDLWNFMNDFTIAFKPIYDATIKLQSESLTLSDFYIVWKECELELDEIGTDLSRNLMHKMNTRQDKLLNNDALICNIYLDPRFNFEGSTYISEPEKLRAKVEISKRKIIS